LLLLAAACCCLLLLAAACCCLLLLAAACCCLLFPASPCLSSFVVLPVLVCLGSPPRGCWPDTEACCVASACACAPACRYKEHVCRFVFRPDDLNLGAVARAFALLRLPRIKELFGKRVAFAASTVDTAAIKFKDKAREKARQKQLATWKEEAAAAAAAKPPPRPKLPKKPLEGDDGDCGGAGAGAGTGAMTLTEKKKAKRKRLSKHARLVNEWERFGFENSLAKKVKKGKITQEEFEAALRGAGVDSEASLDDDDSDA
jgi:hypothetical protein